MSESKMAELFEKAPVSQAVLKNALPAMAAMLMVLIYNLADTFFIGQTHDDLQVAAVSLAMPVFLMFMAAGTVFGMGGTSVISRALGEGNREYARKVCAFCMWSCIIVGHGHVGPVFDLHGSNIGLGGSQRGYMGVRKDLSLHCESGWAFYSDLKLLLKCDPSRGKLRASHDGPTPGQSSECDP